MTVRKTILLVEDNPDDEELTLRALNEQDLSADIIVARDGEEALNYLFGAEKSEYERRMLPQVVLLDLKLPKLNGLDVLKQIRSNPRTRYLPVVVMTSSNEEKDIRTSFDLGANSYVRKSIEYHRLIQEIQQIAAYWVMLNQMPPSEGQIAVKG